MDANTVKGRLSGSGTPQDIPMADLPISSATQTALDGKLPSSFTAAELNTAVTDNDVALRNGGNTFSGNQSITGNATITGTATVGSAVISTPTSLTILVGSTNAGMTGFNNTAFGLFTVVMKGYVSQDAFDNSISNARKVYRLDTFKKEETRKLYEDVIIPAVTEEVQIEAVIDEEGNELEPARTDIVTVQAEKVEQRESGEETIRLNEKDYIDVSQLVEFILPFIGNTLISQGDFIDGQLA